MTDQKNENKTILAVLAHPDDESFGMGGTLAYYAEQGVDVRLVCATRGEVGDVPPKYMKGFNSVAEVRTAELMCAADKLGLTSVDFLDFRDSGMPGSEDNKHPNAFVAQPTQDVVGKIVQYIRKYRPDIILTFDPVGGYRHPDHITVHQTTVEAFYAAGDINQFPGEFPEFQPDKLYFNFFSRKIFRYARTFLSLFGKDAVKFGRNKDMDLNMLIADEDYPPHVRIRYKMVADRRDAASKCHASQIDFDDEERHWLFRLYQILNNNIDRFTRVYPPTPKRFRKNDLFAE